jgi:pimeloyl-ACP methyl ester carboxylesterase
MKQTFVLVHGAFAGAYAWDLIVPALESAGHQVITFDLPGHGADLTPPQNVTFDAYVDTVAQHIDNQSEKVILVGHSMGGVVITAVAEKMPEKIAKLVYLSAYLPKNGQNLQELAESDAESLIGRNLQFTPDYSGGYLPEAITEQVFAGDCSDDIKHLVVEQSKGRLEPLAAFQAKTVITDANFGSVDKYYIETLKDQGVGTSLQKQMVADNGTVKQVFSIDSGHSPYFAKPAELVAILTAL